MSKQYKNLSASKSPVRVIKSTPETVGTSNENLKARIKSGGESRDSLLNLIVERLGRIRTLQLREQEAIVNQDDWERDVGRGVKGFNLPETSRWHQSAKEYKEAAQALSRGDVARGSLLLERAMESERIAIEEFPDFLQKMEDNFDEGADYGSDPAFGDLQGIKECPETELPEGIQLADRITALGEDAPPVRTIRPLQKYWWLSDEEEEEEEEEEEGK